MERVSPLMYVPKTQPLVGEIDRIRLLRIVMGYEFGVVRLGTAYPDTQPTVKFPGPEPVWRERRVPDKFGEVFNYEHGERRCETITLPIGMTVV